MSPTMRAWETNGTGIGQMRLAVRPIPEPGPEDVLVEIHVCGVCGTDLHVTNGDLAQV